MKRNSKSFRPFSAVRLSLKPYWLSSQAEINGDNIVPYPLSHLPCFTVTKFKSIVTSGYRNEFIWWWFRYLGVAQKLILVTSDAPVLLQVTHIRRLSRVGKELENRDAKNVFLTWGSNVGGSNVYFPLKLLTCIKSQNFGNASMIVAVQLHLLIQDHIKFSKISFQISYSSL